MMRPDDYTEQAREVLAASQETVRSRQHSQWDVEHVLLSLLELDNGLPAEILRHLGISAEAVRDDLDRALENSPKVSVQSPQIYATPRASRLLENAKNESAMMKDEFIGVEHLLLAAATEREGDAARILDKHGVTKEKLYQALKQVRGPHRVTDPRAESRYRALERYSIDLTDLASQGRLDPVVGTGRRGPQGHADPNPAEEEQPRNHRRGRSGQDGHSRGARSTHRVRGRAHRA